MSQGFSVDPRLPVSSTVSEDDPNHPKNVVRNMLVVQNQTTADTKYDVSVKRLDGFTTQNTERVRLVAAIIGILVGIALAMRTPNMIVRILLLTGVAWCIHYVIRRVENRTV